MKYCRIVATWASPSALRRAWHSHVWLILLAAPAVLATSGCAPLAGPGKATCGWTVSIPKNGNQVCAVTYATLAAIARAESAGNDARIRRLVSNPASARTLIRLGARLRAQRLSFLRVARNILLGPIHGNRVGVSAFVVGKTRHTVINEQEAGTVRIGPGRARILSLSVAELPPPTA